MISIYMWFINMPRGNLLDAKSLDLWEESLALVSCFNSKLRNSRKALIYITLGEKVAIIIFLVGNFMCDVNVFLIFNI